MNAINNWNNVKEAGGDIEVLPAGGYVCRIEKCAEKPNKSGKGTHLEILFDVVEGEYKGWFADDWKDQDREDKFWRGIIRQNVPDESSAKYSMQCGFFKKFTNAVEASNPGYHWDWNEAGLKGKLVGIVFGSVERQSSRGTRYMTTQAESITNIQAIRDGRFRIPEPRKLPEAQPGPAFTELPDDEADLPF